MTINELPQPPVSKTGWPWTTNRTSLPATMPDGSPWPKISLVTPSYNQGEFLEETIRSVLMQGYPNLEYIIVDGGSTDQSVEIIRKYEPWLAFWVSEKDAGQADAINKGWQRATGDFLGWLNSDDLLTPGCLELEINYFAKHPEVGFIFGDLERIDVDGRQYDVTTYRDFDLVDIVKRAGWISQQGNLMRRRVFEEVGLLDTSLHFMMDMDLWVRAGLVCQFGYLREPVARFRRHKDTKTKTRIDLAGKDILVVYGKLFSRPDLPVALRLAEKEAWGNAHLYAAVRYSIAGKYSGAWKNLLDAGRSYPQLVLQRRYLQFLLSQVVANIAGGKDTRLFRTAKQLAQRWMSLPAKLGVG